MKHIFRLSENDACRILKWITEKAEEFWDIHFVGTCENVKIDESHPVICDDLNLFLLSDYMENEIAMPDPPIPGHKVIGIYGDDEFAWVCRRSDMSIVEIDPYDLAKKDFESKMAFPSLAHYLLFVADYNGREFPDGV